jgi:two-component system, chemotaxis family, CheB/CheR fusion protein
MSTPFEDAFGLDSATSTRSGAALEAAYDAAPVGLCVLDEELRYVRVNTALAQMHGVAADEHIGRPIGTVLPWLAPELEPLARQVLDGGVPFLQHTLTIVPGGSGVSRRWQVSLCPLRARDGRTVGVTGLVQELSDDATVEHLASVIRASPDAIVSLTADGLIVTWNDAAERLLGYTASEVIGRSARTLVPNERSDEWMHFLGLASHGGAILNYETVWVRKDGTAVEVALAVTGVRGATGNTTALSIIVRDAGEQRRAEEALTAADRREDEFLSLLGHELRGPVGVILHAVQLLNADKPDHVYRIREVIERQARHLARLFDDLLEMGRIASGKIDLTAELVDLYEVAKLSVADRADTDLNHREITLRGTSTWVEGDPARLEQVCSILLDTAVKYSPPGGKIEVTVEPVHGAAVLHIADAGAGTSPEASPRLLDLFGQERAAPAGRERLGLGLTVAKRLAEMQGGSVTASSGGHRGSEFTMKLPLHTGPITDPAHVIRASPAVPGRRVLVIEDDRDARETLRLVLEEWGHRLEEAEDGRAGFEKLLAFRPDVALIDIGLPDVDGYEVARTARAHPDTRDLYLVALTGYRQPEDHRVAMEAGFDAVLIKPVDWELLQRLIAERRAVR